MRNSFSSFIKGIRQMVSGKDGQLSLRRMLALIFSIDFVYNLHYIFRYWQPGNSYADASMIFGIEAGLIAALLSLTTYNNIATNNNEQNRPSDTI
jgi:hypothetical protein